MRWPTTGNLQRFPVVGADWISQIGTYESLPSLQPGTLLRWQSTTTGLQTARFTSPRIYSPRAIRFMLLLTRNVCRWFIFWLEIRKGTLISIFFPSPNRLFCFTKRHWRRVGRDRGLWGCVYSIQYTTFTRTVKSETGAATARGQKMCRRRWMCYLKFSW